MNSFSVKLVDFSSVNSFSALAVDYLSSAEGLKQFQSFDFSNEGFADAIEARKKKPVDRNVLIEVLRKQYSKLENGISSSDKTQKNIDLLGKATTFTVSTGHQLNIFTGPVYFIYKIISAINLSVSLKQRFPQYDFIPVYWMASEDHDLEEINHIHLFGKKIEWKPEGKGASGRTSSKGIPAVISNLKELFQNHNSTDRLLKLFSTAYNEKNNLTEATRIIIHELFSEFGLVTLNADDPLLKKLFRSEMEDDAINHTSFKLVEETVRELEKKYKAQVHPREINLFYLRENFRERIVEEAGTFKVLNSELKFSREELINEIKNKPELFSPNVVLRPLYQEKVLPNIAYVGGPAEISYWLQYKKMFEYYHAYLPVLVHRNCVMVMDSASREKLKKLGLSAEDIFLNEEDLVKKYLKKNSPGGFSIDALLNKTDSLFNDAINEINAVDPTLKATAEAEKQKMLNSLKGLDERIRRAEKKKNETALNQLRKLKEKFFPDNKLQERYENILSFYSKFGDDFLKVLIQNLDPFEKKFILLMEDAGDEVAN